MKLGAGNYGSYEAGLAAGTGLSDDTAVRVSLYQRESDGYVDNLYLNKPTQQQDEQVARVKLNSQVSDNLALEFAYHHIDTENGYDGFTLDNSRNSVADTQAKTTSAPMRFHYAEFILAQTYSMSNLKYLG